MARLRAGETAAGTLTADELALLDWVYPGSASPGGGQDGGGVHRLRPKPPSKAEVDHFNAETSRAVSLLQRAGHPEVRASITASEIQFGALDRLQKPTFRYFYFRDEAVTASIPEPHAATYREPPGSFGAVELENLEQRIRDPRTRGLVLAAPGQVVEAPLPVYDYPCAWDPATARITRLHAFGRRVYDDLMASVVAQFGPAEEASLDELEEENAAIEAFVEPRVERYVVGSRGEVFTRLHQHADGSGENGILCVVGAPGSGKSALLARFLRELQQGTPAHAPRSAALVIPHFVGASAASTNVRSLLRRLCHELQAGAASREEIPDDYDKLREVFPGFLERAAAARPVVLLIDAINQLDPAHQAHAMRWLPETLPPNARAVLTALEKPGEKTPALEALRRRRSPPLEVPLRPLDEHDAQEIIGQFLARYRKTLDHEQRALLLRKRDAGNPLYLLTALEELRTLGVYEEIKRRIAEMPEEIQAATASGEPGGLFVWILRERLEKDDGFRDDAGRLIGPELVGQYCSLLGVGRAGMAARELAELVSPAPPRRAEDTEEPPADHLGNVAALQRLLRPYLMHRGELLDFFHGQLKEAVQALYLATPEARLAAHRQVADYFRRRADPAGDATWSAHFARGLAELPHHLIEGERWDDAFAVLTDLGFLEEKCTYVAVQESGEGNEKRKVYAGVYELQEDYRQALEKWPAEG